jgi:predicted amidohydrolase
MACGEEKCLYNTLVLYDKFGKMLAKYHKYNLFNTEFPWFNIDKEPQNVYVDTELGTILCYNNESLRQIL